MKHFSLSLLILGLPLLAQQPKADPFAIDRILTINIQMSADDWKYVRTSHRKGGDDFAAFAEDAYEYRRADVSIDGVKIGSVGVRKKGFIGSALSTRPSLKINFDKYVKGQQFEGLEMLTLNNNNQDKSMVQSVIAYDFFRRAGVPGSRAGFAHVTVNGEDLGVYTNVESVDKALMQRLFGNSNGILYEGYAGDLTAEQSARIVEKSGGKDQNRDRIKELTALLAAPGPVSLAKVRDYVELDSFLKLWVSEVLIGHWDSYSGNRNNYYVYQDAKTQKLNFLPWGPDSVFNDPGPFISRPVPKSVKAVGVLCRRLWELPAVRTLYRAEMARQLEGVWNEDAMLARIAQLQGNVAKVTTANKAAATANTEMIVSFVKARRAEVMKEITGVVPDWPDLGDRPIMGIGQQMVISGTFEAPFLAAAPANPFGTGSAAFKVTGMKTNPVFQRFGASTVISGSVGLEGIREGYPLLNVMGMEEATNKVWVLSIVIDPYRLDEKTTSLPVDHFEVWARVIEGTNTRIFGVTGEMKFSGVSLKAGGKLAGSFTLTTAAF